MGAGADVPSSPEKTVVERFSASPDGLKLAYEYTVKDPVYLSTPFSHRVEWARLASDTPVLSVRLRRRERVAVLAHD